jgi:Tfp pilus assembly protein FimT
MTLVELLVVVSIGVLLLGMALPLMKPAVQEGRIREVARQVSVFFAIAKARAAESGNVVAVWIERSSNDPNAAQELFLAESPPPYVGDTLVARTTAFTAAGTNMVRVTFDANSLTLPALVKSGDVIKFNYQGASYQIVNVSPLSTGSNPPAPWVDILVPITSPPLPDVSRGLPYQILRQPTKSMLSPLQLNGNVAVDLQYSGMGRTGWEFRDDATQTIKYPVLIAFSPGGRVDHVAYGGMSRPASGTIHLLIGRRDKIPDPSGSIGVAGSLPLSASNSTMTPYSEDIIDVSNIWVSIGHSTGSVTSAENAWAMTPAPPNSNFTDSWLMAREFAQSSQPMGGL